MERYRAQPLTKTEKYSTPQVTGIELFLFYLWFLFLLFHLKMG